MKNDERKILAIETSGRMGSAAIGTAVFGDSGDEGGVRQVQMVEAVRLPGSMSHASELIPAINRMFERHGWPSHSITDVFVSIGPGSFTGLRIGVTLARTLAWSLDARIVAVPTVDALARNALETDPPPAHLAVVLDAKRRQIYTAAFDIKQGKMIKTIDACLSDPTDFFSRCPKPLAVLGEGVAYHREAIDASGVSVLDETLWPGRAENVFHVGLELAAAGQYAPRSELMPLYIRRPEAEEKWEKLHGTD